MKKTVAKIRTYIGLDLPPRNCELNFSIPPVVSREHTPVLNRLHLGKKNANKSASIEYLNECAKEARRLSRCKLPVGKRMQITEDFVGIFMPIAIKHVRTYSEDGGIPDTETRQEILDLVADILKLLVDSYKITYKTLYFKSNFRFARSLKSVELSAFRILELTKFKQRVKGLRYELISDSAWVTVNSVFHSMLALGKENRPIPLLENIFVEEEDPKRQTLSNLYLSLQMIAKCDILKWPTEWQSFFDIYAKSVDTLVQWAPDKGGTPVRGTSISYSHDNRPARMVRATPADEARIGPSGLVVWTLLFKKVTNDFLMFFADKNQTERANLPRKFVLLSYNERLALTQLQFDCAMSDSDSTPPEEGGGSVCDLRIFIGFKSVFELIHNIHIGGAAIGSRLVDKLATHSAVFGEDHIATVESVWFVQYQDDKVIRLRTQETKYTTSMKIGSMAAYGFGNEGIAKPHFGIISRIYRPSAKTVIVDMLKAGEFIEPVVLTAIASSVEALETKQQPQQGGILIKDVAGETKLLLPPQCLLREKNLLEMKRKQSSQNVVLGKVQTVTKDFFMFRLSKA
jgi:hypothetical protein